MQREKSAVPLPHGRPVAPWNKGRFIGPKPPLKPKQVWAMSRPGFVGGPNC